MLRNKVIGLSVLAVAVGMMIPRTAGAVTKVCNVGTVNYSNNAATPKAMAAVSSGALDACITTKSNPSLTITKIVDNLTPAIGDTVTYTITVVYPKITDVTDVCGDDSVAKNIVVTDAIPVGVTYTPGTLKLITHGVSKDLTDVVDLPIADEGEVVGANLTVRPSDMNEGDGDTCDADNTRVITFQAVVQ
jgi:fimbrial isopeptide formation D2 family protein